MITIIPIGKINLGASPQARHQIHIEAVEEYKEALLAGELLPPIDLYRDLLSEHYLIGNGCHRFLAYQRAGWAVVPATVHDGGRAEALLCACRANTGKEHGIKRSREDAQKAVELFLREPGWAKKSDREVAKACSVSDKTVAPIRERLEKEKLIDKTTERVGADGKTRSLPERSTAEFRSSEGDAPSTQTTLFADKTPAEDLCQWPDEPCSAPRLREQLFCARHAKVFGDALKESMSEVIISGSIEDTSRVESPKIPAGFCQHEGCGKRAFGDGIYCTNHAPVDHAAIERSVETSMAKIEASAPTEISSGTRKAIKRVKCVCPKCSGKGHEGIVEKYECLLCKGAGVLLLLPAPGENGNGPSFQGYCTPKELVGPCTQVESIGLDPTHNDDSIWQADYTICEAQDSLSSLWPWAQLARGRAIALNPPWNNMGPFVDKLLVEVALGASAFLIGPAGNPSSKWWQKAARACALRCDLNERICYLKDGKPDPSPRDSTVVFYFGKFTARFAAVFSRLGLVSKALPEEHYAGALNALRLEEFNAHRRNGIGAHPCPNA